MAKIPTQIPSHEAISARAKEIWSAEGKPEGQDLEHWYRAENELRGEDHAAGDDEVNVPAGAAAPAGRRNEREVSAKAPTPTSRSRPPERHGSGRS